MCTVINLRLLNNPIIFLKVLFSLYVSIIGITFASTDFLSKAFGSYFISAGVGAFFVGIFSGINVIPQSFGVKRHNKFVLLVCFLVDLLMMCILINTGMNCLTLTTLEFSPTMEADCVRINPAYTTPDECRTYFRADKTAGIRLAWASFYTLQGNPIYYQYLSSIQDLNLCCGFGPPLNCINDTRSFPADRPLGHVAAQFVKHRTVCGDIQYSDVKYYPQQKNCIDFYDRYSSPPILGGCSYDMGVGACVSENPKVYNVVGCADKMEAWLISQVTMNALFLIGSGAMNGLCMLVVCCMFWKRKDSDTFPDFADEEKVLKIIIKFMCDHS